MDDNIEEDVMKTEEEEELSKTNDQTQSDEKKKKKKKKKKREKETDNGDQPRSSENENKKNREEREREGEDKRHGEAEVEQAEGTEDGILESLKKGEEFRRPEDDRTPKSLGKKKVKEERQERDEGDYNTLTDDIVDAVEKSIKRKELPVKTFRKAKIQKVYFLQDFIESSLNLAEPFDMQSWPKNIDLSMEKKFPTIEPFHPDSTVQKFVNFCRKFVQRPLPLVSLYSCGVSKCPRFKCRTEH